MKPWMLALALMSAACASAGGAAEARDFDPRTYQSRHVGEPTQVLVLGTPHLSGTPEDFDPAVLEPLLERLAAFKPELIAIEALSGESIDALWRYRAIYPEVATSYGGRMMTMAAGVRHGLQLDLPEAEAAARRTLAEWPAAPTPAQRRRLAALFVAAGDPHSALVQWWRLDLAERRAEDGVSALMVTQLAEYDTRRNENHLIGTRLAVQLGLERVHPVDDHAGDDVLVQRQADVEAFFSQPWVAELMADERFTPLRDASLRLRSPDEVMATYRLLNAPATGQLDADLQWRSMLTRESPNGVGRTRVAEWEARNLRQVAHIREAIALKPGARVLVITGSAHKPWFDAYLSMLVDVEVVDAEAVLR